MRSLTRTSLALAGLALVTATSAWADTPEVEATYKEGTNTQGWEHVHGVTVNPKSMKQYQESQGLIPPPPTMATPGVEGGVCTACQAGAQAPGYAVVGGPSYGPAMAGGGAPGYAVVGGGVSSSEPAPIGVMRAGYQAMNSPAAVGPVAGQGMGMGMPANAAGAPMGGSPHRRHHIVSHILGLPSFGRIQAERERHERAAHAAISYGSAGGPATGLPPSMVYGR